MLLLNQNFLNTEFTFFLYNSWESSNSQLKNAGINRKDL
jgi:hypothetical protein